MAEDDTEVTISAKNARSLVGVIEDARKAVKRINGSKNGEIRSASERYGISGAMANLMAKLCRLTAEDLADWRDEFDHWWAALALDKRAESAPRFKPLSYEEAKKEVEAA